MLVSYEKQNVFCEAYDYKIKEVKDINAAHRFVNKLKKERASMTASEKRSWFYVVWFDGKFKCLVD